MAMRNSRNFINDSIEKFGHHMDDGFYKKFKPYINDLNKKLGGLIEDRFIDNFYRDLGAGMRVSKYGSTKLGEKTPSRIFEKALGEMEKNPDYKLYELRDPARLSIIVGNSQNVYDKVRELKSKFPGLVVEVSAPDSGYRGVHCSCIIDGLCCEIRIHTKEEFYMSALSHKIYEEARKINIDALKKENGRLQKSVKAEDIITVSKNAELIARKEMILKYHKNLYKQLLPKKASVDKNKFYSVFGWPGEALKSHKASLNTDLTELLDQNAFTKIYPDGRIEVDEELLRRQSVKLHEAAVKSQEKLIRLNQELFGVGYKRTDSLALNNEALQNNKAKEPS